MHDFLIDNQILVRVSFFIGALLIFIYWESKSPFRVYYQPKFMRWVRHIGLSFTSKILIRILFPILAIQVAILAAQNDIGIFNSPEFGNIAYWFQVLLSIIFLDFVIYWQHRFMHQWPLLWQMHKVHHIDRFLDVSTGIRFHPLEELLSMVIKFMAIAFIGAPAIAVLIFEVLLNLASLFTHVNVKLSPKLEKKLRYLIVTPDMHRIHHSDFYKETNSNYGFCLSVWDKLFNSYTKYPISGQAKNIWGLEEFQDLKFQSFFNMLLTPFNLKSLQVKRSKKRKLYFS